jgi:hypothetical protein
MLVVVATALRPLLLLRTCCNVVVVAVDEDDAEEEGGEQQHGCACGEEGEEIQAVEQSQEEQGTQGRPAVQVPHQARRHFRSIPNKVTRKKKGCAERKGKHIRVGPKMGWLGWAAQHVRGKKKNAIASHSFCLLPLKKLCRIWIYIYFYRILLLIYYIDIVSTEESVYIPESYKKISSSNPPTPPRHPPLPLPSSSSAAS